jgi:hypothetical protein
MSESVRALSEALDAGDALNLAGGSRNAGEAGPERDARNKRNWYEASSRWFTASNRLRAPRESGEPASEQPKVLRLTGEQLASIEPPVSAEWFIDFDEHEDFVVAASLPAPALSPEPGLREARDLIVDLTAWAGTQFGGLPQTLQDRADWWRLDVDPALAATVPEPTDLAARELAEIAASMPAHMPQDERYFRAAAALAASLPAPALSPEPETPTDRRFDSTRDDRHARAALRANGDPDEYDRLLAAESPTETPGLRAALISVAERYLDDGSVCFCEDYIAGMASPFSTMGDEHANYCRRARAALAESPTETPGCTCVGHDHKATRDLVGTCGELTAPGEWCECPAESPAETPGQRAAAKLLCGYMGHEGPCEAHLAFAADHYEATR